MRRELIIIGGGEHAGVVIEAARADRREWSILGFVDPNGNTGVADRLGIPHLGDDSCLTSYTNACAVLGFGSRPGSTARMDAAARLHPRVAEWATVVHRDAWISPTASIGKGVVVMAGAIVQSHAHIGTHAIVNSGVIVEHDVVVEDHCQIAPGVVIGGGTRIGAGTYIGLGATVRDHINIGERAVIGMGSRVVKDVSTGAVLIEGNGR